MSNNTIYLNNLDTSVNKKKLKEHFSQYGEIKKVHLPLDKANKEAKGYAFITFKEESSVEQSLVEHGKLFLEKEITVEIAKEK